jgi:hypothetical protein
MFLRGLWDPDLHVWDLFWMRVLETVLRDDGGDSLYLHVRWIVG